MSPKKIQEPRTGCIRCGTCCTKGGPALHEEDVVLFKNGALDRIHVYTLRKGELVRDLDDTLKEIDHEIIKIKGQDESWTCLFFDDQQKSCNIYDQRPVECRALKCWDPLELRKVMARPYLKRKDLLNIDDGIIKLIDTHEERCSYKTLKTAVKKLQGPDSQEEVEKILDLLKYDNFIRPFLGEKFGLNPEMMDFFFGRPLTTTIRMFGLCVKQEGKTFILTKVSS